MGRQRLLVSKVVAWLVVVDIRDKLKALIFSRGSINSSRTKSGGDATTTTGSPGTPDRDKDSNSGRSSAESTSSVRQSDIRKGNPNCYSDGASLHLNMNSVGSAGKYGGTKSGDGNGSTFTSDISRRTSSCTSQISGDDRRQLYRYSKFAYDSHEYGSILSQVREANTEASSSWEFTNKFFSILCRSAFATALFVILAVLPLSMAFMGIKYLNECPLKPFLPLYLLIGGCCAMVEIIWNIYAQVQSRKYEHCDASFFEEDTLLGTSTVKVMQWALRGFLLFWFALGNSWIWELQGPDGNPPPPVAPIKEPTRWCSGQLYIFSIVHLYIVYGLAAALVLLWTACFIVSAIRSYRVTK